MRFPSCLVVFLCAGVAFAQGDDPEVTRAKAGIERLRGLVAAGAAPRAQLEKAEDSLADAQDAAFLRKTVYGQDLTEDQADEVIAAANRRFERRKKAFDDARKLVDLGVTAEASLNALQDELDMARKECELAETRAELTREIARAARVEESLEAGLRQAPSLMNSAAERYDGDGVFTPGRFARLESAFESRFGKTLPVSAMGETAVHRAMGFDHRGRVDVAVNPDQPEGVWLRQYLTANHIPFFAFRQAVPGKATGAHIHLGPVSTRLASGG